MKKILLVIGVVLKVWPVDCFDLLAIYTKRTILCFQHPGSRAQVLQLQFFSVVSEHLDNERDMLGKIHFK